MNCDYVYKTCDTVSMFSNGYTYMATYVSRVMYDNTQINFNFLTFNMHMHVVCPLRAGI